MIFAIKNFQEIFIFLASIVHNPLGFFIIDEDKHGYVTKNGQLHGLLKNAFLSLAVSHLSLGVNRYPRDLINFLFTHADQKFMLAAELEYLLFIYYNSPKYYIDSLKYNELFGFTIKSNYMYIF